MANPLAADLEHCLEHTRDLWSELREARIFVTGGTGFFGCWLLESFSWAHDHLRLNATLTALTRSPEAFAKKAPHLAKHPAIHLLAGDVRDFAFPGGSFTHIVHAATEANAALNRDQPLVMLDTIVEGTRHALDFAVACGAIRFLLTSSGAVYGTQPSAITHIPESYGGGPDPCDPKWTYGEGKRLSEMLATIYHKQHGVECAIARCFAFVGPYLPLDTHFAIGNFIGNRLRGEPVAIGGDGTPYRSYLYAADLAIWLWTILLRGEPSRPYNVGSEHDLTIAELAEVVSPGNVTIRGVPQPGALPERYVPATARARDELQLQEYIGLEEAIQRTANWHAQFGT